MTATRPWPYPDMSKTIHFIGDPHYGGTLSARLAKVKADLDRVPAPLCHVSVGDLVHDSANMNAPAAAWMEALDAPWYSALGNHDILDNFQTPAQWAAAIGMPGKNYTVDLGLVLLVFVGPDGLAEGDSVTITLSQATLDWLDAQLTAATKDCWVVCHAPLKDTVVGSTSVVWSSAEAAFYAEPNTSIRTILNNRTRAKAWISGHTHSPTTTTDFLKTENVGSRTIAAINCSGLQYVGRTNEWYDDLKTLYLTKTDSGIEVRVRNHGGGVWGAINGAKVTTL